MIARAWQILVVASAGWLNRQQQDVLEYLQEENRVLREHLKDKGRRACPDEGVDPHTELATVLTQDRLQLRALRFQSGVSVARLE